MIESEKIQKPEDVRQFLPTLPAPRKQYPSVDRDEEVRELNHENNRFLLSDTNALLHNLVKGDSSFVFEKIGTTIRNVMIDEFQDTSAYAMEHFRLFAARRFVSGSRQLDCRRRETIHLPLEKR